jgi:hypothetical protein
MHEHPLCIAPASIRPDRPRHPQDDMKVRSQSCWLNVQMPGPAKGLPCNRNDVQVDARPRRKEAEDFRAMNAHNFDTGPYDSRGQR